MESKTLKKNCKKKEIHTRQNAKRGLCFCSKQSQNDFQIFWDEPRLRLLVFSVQPAAPTTATSFSFFISFLFSSLLSLLLEIINLLILYPLLTGLPFSTDPLFGLDIFVTLFVFWIESRKWARNFNKASRVYVSSFQVIIELLKGVWLSLYDERISLLAYKLSVWLSLYEWVYEYI